MKKNVVANLLGTAWIAVLNILAVPFYVRYLGVEAYGLIGFYVTLQATFFVLDFGLSASLIREIAYLGAQKNYQEQRNLLRSTEIIYWAIAALLSLGIFLCAPIISRSWLKAQSLSSAQTIDAIRLMAIVILFRWPVTLYLGCLAGQQKQVLSNILKCSTDSLRVFGVIAILHFYSSTIHAFFLWQILTTAISACALGAASWWNMPKTESSAQFSWSSIKSIRTFAAGMTGISLTAVLLSQMDKILLSKILSLKEFGFYALASSLALGLTQISGPVSTAAYPRFTELVAEGNSALLKKSFYTLCEFVGVFILPLTSVLFFFSPDVLSAWTQNVDAVNHASAILRLLSLGMCLNVLVTLPYTFQLAHRWTKLTLTVNVLALMVSIPVLWWAANRWGGLGAAAVWLCVNAVYVIVNVQIMHRRLIGPDTGAWYWSSVIKPSVAAFGVSALFLLWPHSPLGRLSGAAFLGVVWIVSAGAALSVSANVRREATEFLRQSWLA